jgi:hypothetical protein
VLRLTGTSAARMIRLTPGARGAAESSIERMPRWARCQDQALAECHRASREKEMFQTVCSSDLRRCAAQAVIFKNQYVVVHAERSLGELFELRVCRCIQ